MGSERALVSELLTRNAGAENAPDGLGHLLELGADQVVQLGVGVVEELDHL